MGGIFWSAPHQIRATDIRFYGGGYKHVEIECLVAQTNKLLMHYGCPSNDDLEVKVLLEYLLVNLGMSKQPFHISYE